MIKTLKPNMIRSGIKMNLNFLDKPMFITSRLLSGNNTFGDSEGYSITVKNDKHLPNMFDRQILYMLMQRAQLGHKNIVTFNSLRDISHAMGSNNGTKALDRIEESIIRWQNVVLTFNNNMYFNSNVGYTTEEFNIISETTVEQESVESKKKRIIVALDNHFMAQHEKQYTTEVYGPVIFMLKNQLALRLYELLTKSFISSNKWVINIDNLIEKLGCVSRRDLSLTIKNIIKATQKISMVRGNVKDVEAVRIGFNKMRFSVPYERGLGNS